MIQRLTAVTVPRPDIAPLYTCSLPALGKGQELRALGVSVRLRSRLGLGADIHDGWGQVSVLQDSVVRRTDIHTDHATSRRL